MTIQDKPTTEKKLHKVTSKFAALEAELQLIVPPKVFDALTQLCRLYLAAAGDSDAARDYIAKLAFIFRQEAYQRFGHESLETFALAKLMRQTESKWTPKLPRLDSISWIRAYRNKDARLDSSQEEAAECIKRVWTAFGRFMGIAGRGFEGGGGSRGRVLSPLDVMDQSQWEDYNKIYIPWYERAKITQVDRRRGNSHISLAAIVFKILVDDLYPEELDSSYCLVRGSSLKALKAALSCYWSPEALATFGAPQTPAPVFDSRGHRLAVAGDPAPAPILAPSDPKPGLARA